MKKTLLYVACSLLALVLIAYVTLQFFFGSIVKTSVNQVGSRITQSKVELGGASISPLSGTGSLTNFTVGNPPGWSSGNLLHVGRIQFDVEPRSFFGDALVINELSLDQPEFIYETKIISSNLGDLLKNIEASVGKGADTGPADKNAKPRKFIVRHFHLQNAKVAVGVGPAAIPLPLPTIELTDLGVAEGGLTSGQLAVAVLRELMPQIIAATTDAAGRLGGTMGSAASETLKKAGESLQKFLGSGKK